jgi:hypothetical protein
VDVDGVDPEDYDDPEHPPPGYQAAPCMRCSSGKPEQVQMAVGPIPGIDLGPNKARTLCPTCRGRRWVWRLVA